MTCHATPKKTALDVLSNKRNERRLLKNPFSRRDFLWMTFFCATGCAVNPATGKQQVLLLSPNDEVQIDKTQSPHQYSADYGVSTDQNLNRYLTEIGMNIAKVSHRPDMPYQFVVVNSNVVNAYAFPGGSIAATRGILVGLDSEAELAALLGHEVGHVNARHAAQRQTKSIVAGIALTGAAAVLGRTKLGGYTGALQSLGAFGTGALLAFYGREDERESDRLGMEYMVRAQQNPLGMVELMDVLQAQRQGQPNSIELMMSSHPMSNERRVDAERRANQEFSSAQQRSMSRERYLDNIAHLRTLKPAIELQQQAEVQLGKGDFNSAAELLSQSLAKAPNDYTGLILMAKCQMALEKPQDARNFAKRAIAVYPTEAQAHHIEGLSLLATKNYETALASFNQYQRLLPGNPSTTFLKGLTFEGLQNKASAAKEFQGFLSQVRQGEQAEYALKRLTEWGYAAT
ncbi:MAG: M48 family metalloprotease [Pseudomonadota bacterium]